MNLLYPKGVSPFLVIFRVLFLLLTPLLFGGACLLGPIGLLLLGVFFLFILVIMSMRR